MLTRCYRGNEAVAGRRTPTPSTQMAGLVGRLGVFGPEFVQLSGALVPPPCNQAGRSAEHGFGLSGAASSASAPARRAERPPGRRQSLPSAHVEGREGWEEEERTRVESAYGAAGALRCRLNPPGGSRERGGGGGTDPS